jgi:hypothetical protein
VDPIAYTYEADYHCPYCTKKRFGVDEHGYPPETSKDSEGNQLGALAPWDEWYDIGYGSQSIYCGTCGDLIDRYEDD